MSVVTDLLFGSPSSQTSSSTTESQSTTKPVLFDFKQLQSPERQSAFQAVTPSLLESGLGGIDPAEEKRLTTSAFEDIGATTKSTIENLRDIFGASGIRGGAQKTDIENILEAEILARGEASTDIQDILKDDAFKQLEALLALLGIEEPFTTSLESQMTSESETSGEQTGGQTGLIEGLEGLTGAVTGTSDLLGALGKLSDIRHKKNVQSISDSVLSIMAKLRPVTYDWKNPKDKGMEGTQIGFIAQEVEEVLPEVVLTQNDKEQTKSIKYNEFIPLIVKAIQELKSENVQLRQAINTAKEA